MLFLDIHPLTKNNNGRYGQCVTGERATFSRVSLEECALYNIHYIYECWILNISTCLRFIKYDDS